MKVIEPYVELITPIDREAVLKRIEQCGRVCYKSEDKITEDSALQFVRNIIARGHESVLEHCSLTVKFVCDRGVSHEIVRHRIASYSQESSRFCNYTKGKFDGELTFIKPCFWDESSDKYALWHSAMSMIERIYSSMIAGGATAQEARNVLPNSLKTELIMTANLREWRHFLRLRCSRAAHPQMREIAMMLLEELQSELPEFFEDIEVD